MNIPYSQLIKGTFLIASPDITEGLFYRGVILLCEHTMNGSFGLIVNKPLQVDIPEDVLGLSEVNSQLIAMRAGGTMGQNQMMLIHSSKDIPEQALEICPGVFLGGDLPFLKEALTQNPPPSVLLCFGYQGWTGGELERAFLNQEFFLCPATKELLFQTPPNLLWQTLLRQMGGKYASLSMIPEDLSLN